MCRKRNRKSQKLSPLKKNKQNISSASSPLNILHVSETIVAENVRLLRGYCQIHNEQEVSVSVKVCLLHFVKVNSFIL